MRKYITLVLLTLLINGLLAQKNLINNNEFKDYNTGLELFEKENYANAQKYFQNTIDRIDNPASEISINAEYYVAMCAIELFNKDAEYILKQFIRNNPQNHKINDAVFKLATFLYYKKRYSEAIKWFDRTDVKKLDGQLHSEFYFKSGYSYFSTNKFDKAKKNLAEIIDIDSKYFSSANYYYGQIEYDNHNYENALKSFLKLTDKEEFKNIVPYYIVQIYYLKKDYNKLIEYGPTIVDSINIKRAPEIARLIGEAYYDTEDFKNAIPYLEKYQNKVKGSIERFDYFQLGFSYYKTENYKKAIENLKNATTPEDSLCQNINYILGDCYIKTNQKDFARNCFAVAYKLTFDKAIQEDALFNYAKLSYETAYNPYNEAILSLQKYIKTYPKSERLNEAYQYLVNIYLTTKNYRLALESLDKIKNKDRKIQEAYQKIAYYRAIELFNDRDYKESIKNFDKSSDFNMDDNIYSLCYYWKAEAYYKMSNFDSSIYFNKKFQAIQSSKHIDVYNTSNYNLGYANFKKKEYSMAEPYFERFVMNKSKEQVKVLADAYNRIADCFFMIKTYKLALTNYDKAYEQKSTDADYALYQKAICQGLLDLNNSKINSLTTLINDYKKSHYVVDAKYELANAYLDSKENNKALEFYNQIIEDYSTSSYLKNSLFKKGLILFNQNKNKEALSTFKQLVNNYPATPESKEALISIKNIYVEMDSVESFFAYAKSLSFANVTANQQDSISYMATENKYLDGDCESSLKGFTNYLNKFPNGSFAINANYYKAECELKNNKLLAALDNYYVVANSSSKFTESALIKASNISYNLNKFDTAYNLFGKLERTAEYKNNILEGRIGLMRCAAKLNKRDSILKYTALVVNTDKVPADIIAEARLLAGKTYMAVDSLDLAQKEFDGVVKVIKNEMSAEAKYNIALICFKKKNYQETEKKVFEIINSVPSYDYWIAKSFILLSDNYVKTDNTFQAKQTLQSIIENYDGDDLKKEAKEKLKELNNAQKVSEQKKSQEEMEIKFKNSKSEEKLFDHQ